MQPFDFVREHDVPSAVKAGSRDAAKFIAGGTNLVDLMKCDVERPSHIVDINDVSLSKIERVDAIADQRDRSIAAIVAGTAVLEIVNAAQRHATILPAHGPQRA